MSPWEILACSALHARCVVHVTILLGGQMAAFSGKPKLSLKGIVLGCGLFSLPLHGGEIVINSMHSDPTAKKAFDAVVEAFKTENPAIKVKVNQVDHESYKVQIRTWLPNNPPDVATWFAGNRARFFVEHNLVEPIDDIWAKHKDDFAPSAASAVTFGGKVYLMPTTYYNWGFYYRKDLFEKAGIAKAPESWTEFLTAIQKISAQGITPITIGTKWGWPAAAWFDFLNLRMHGAEFHLALLNGQQGYEDPRVVKVMQEFRNLVDKGAFPKNAAAMSWQDASTLLWQGKAAMYLMGNFIATEIPADLNGKIGFFKFPIMDPNVPLAEVAPTDVFFIPAKAKNKTDAKVFLSFLGTPKAQGILSKINKLLPTNAKTPLEDPTDFQKQGLKSLQDAKVLTQFYDRDADPEVAKVGMDAFVEFMAFPDRITSILAKVEKTRKRVHR